MGELTLGQRFGRGAAGSRERGKRQVPTGEQGIPDPPAPAGAVQVPAAVALSTPACARAGTPAVAAGAGAGVLLSPGSRVVPAAAVSLPALDGVSTAAAAGQGSGGAAMATGAGAGVPGYLARSLAEIELEAHYRRLVTEIEYA